VKVGIARNDHPEVSEIVPSAHCIVRFRQRLPVGAPGGAAVAAALLQALEDADVSRWPPAWAISDAPAERWAVTGDLAFPLTRTPTPGRWLAITCLRR
jgi:hypothetical protein